MTPLKQLLVLFDFEEGQTSTRLFCFFKKKQKQKRPSFFHLLIRWPFFALLVTYPFLKPHPDIFPPSCFQKRSYGGIDAYDKFTTGHIQRNRTLPKAGRLIMFIGQLYPTSTKTTRNVSLLVFTVTKNQKNTIRP